MECNKEEAERAVEIAQRKLGMKDLEGARKFAVKAQQLYPLLPALSQLMPILDVLLAAHHSINSEMDWYAILQLDDINVMADDSLVRKQYRKLALLLHPDKNKIVGSESAFKLIVDAWGVLSDKIRRAIYDQKRKANPHLKTHSQNPKRPPQRRATPKKKPPENGSFNGGRGSINCASFIAAPNLTQQSKSVNFWTVCPSCGMQYEYHCVYENKNLLCRNCRKPFLAVKAAAIPLSAMSNFSTSCYPWSHAPVGLNNSTTSFGTGVGGFANGVIPNLNFTWSGPFEGAGPNFAAVDSTAENMKVSCDNVVDSKEEPVDESHKENLPEKDEYDVLIKKPRKQKVPKACKPLSSSFHDVPSSCKAPVSPKVPLSTMETSSPKSTSGKAASSPKVTSSTKELSSPKVPSCTKDSFPTKVSPSTKAASSPNVSAKKRNFDDCCQGSEDEVSARKSNCIRKDIDLNKVDAEVFHSDASKEQPKKSFPEVAFTSPLRANQTNKPSGKQGPGILRKDCLAKSVRDLLAEKAKMDIRKNLSEVKRKAEKAAADKEEAEKAAAAKEEAEKAAAAKEKAMAAAAKKEALAAAAKKEASTAARKKTVEDESRKASVSARSPDKAKKCAKIEKKEIQNMTKKPVSYKKTYKKQEEVMKSEIIEKPAFDSRSITVPDSDFYDFDKDRTENCFDTNQIWATYDDENGMPRFYARIVRVVSLDPFKVQMNWIEPKLHKYQTCGEFTVGKVISSYMLNIYSHLMKWEKSPKGIFTIVPRKSDVWAIYREWDSTWDENTPAEIRHKYEIVEVLTDFSEELGVSVVPLVKVSGFRNLFRKQHLASQSSDEWVVPKAELLRFSHQIPARRLTKEDSPIIPEGCWEVDPAATPIDVLCQGNTETKKKEPWTGEKVEAAEERGGEAEDRGAEAKTKFAEFEIKIELGEERAAG